MDENSEPRITIEVSKSDTIIRVENISTSDTLQFDEAYRTARRLLGRIPRLDQNIEAELMVKAGKLATDYVWTKTDDEYRLAENPTEPQERVALSLLRVYPQCMREIDIVKETGVRQNTVNRHLTGERKVSQGFFSICDGGYTLTTNGIDWVLKEVIPALNTEDQLGEHEI